VLDFLITPGKFEHSLHCERHNKPTDSLKDIAGFDF